MTLMSTSLATSLLICRTKPHPVILSAAKDLKKVSTDAVGPPVARLAVLEVQHRGKYNI
jgi:hypothetical protein